MSQSASEEDCLEPILAMRFTRLDDWLAWQQTLHPNAIDLGLDRVHCVLARLQWQQPSVPTFVVGGTNGKGSTVAFLEAILRASTRRVGTFTSPHLVRYNERIRIDNVPASDEQLCAAFDRIDQARGAESLTFFEFNAIAALLIFASERPDAIVLEVGMGGRLDAVNVVEADATIITSVALDHCEWLGGDVETIGREKAGIFRRARPAILGDEQMPQSVFNVAQEQGALLQQLGSQFNFEIGAAQWNWSNSKIRFDALPLPALAGAAQFRNASAAIAALMSLDDRLQLTQQHIAAGLRTASLPGRFQIRAGQPTWIFDVSHNPAAAQVLAENLATAATSGRTFAVCGVLADKDIAGIVMPLRERVDTWIAVGLPGERALSDTALADRLRTAGAQSVMTASDVASGCELARQQARPEDRIVVFGSFLTVGAALEWARLM